MKKSLVIVFLLVLVPYSYAQWFFHADTVDVNVKISSDFIVEEERAGALIKYIGANVSFFPIEDHRQEILRFTTNPETNVQNGVVPFFWDRPYFGEYSFLIDTDVRLKSVRNKVKGKVDFPIENIPRELRKYTLPSATIDSDNGDIIILASTLASGEDDLFRAVHKLAAWSGTNIQYNLSTLTASVAQPASWVLRERKGVCDELTNLFLAMARSLGIPARFVSGIAYTESPLFPEKWGAHGWAEVYFPDYGWVAYDVTYGQLGFIDPTHIKLRESVDATEPAVGLSWLGKSVEVRTSIIDFDTTLLDFEGDIETGITLQVVAERGSIGFNSYNLINAFVKNTNDYYVSEELRLVKSKDMIVEDNGARFVVLEPGEEKEVSWIVRIGQLEEGYYYTFPVLIYTAQNVSQKGSFLVHPDEVILSRNDIEDILQERQESNGKSYAKDIALECVLAKEEFYLGEESILRCDVVNEGNTFFEKLSICLDKSCQELSLGIAQEKKVSFTLPGNEPGKREAVMMIRSDEVLGTQRISYRVLEKPSVEIVEIQHPVTIGYKDEYVLEFVLKKDSYGNAYDIEIILDHDDYQRTWNIEELVGNRQIVVDMKGKDLKAGENDLRIIVNYKDKDGNSYSENTQTMIELTGLSTMERVLVWINQMERKFFTPWVYLTFIILFFGVSIYIILRK
ncbi:transglutaminase domain-containing protein [Candidatus Woesearchaeota archaeon]|nr:transglutaminase domain-containing protein [Candidatus Woesearchaeota archaeon]